MYQSTSKWYKRLIFVERANEGTSQPHIHRNIRLQAIVQYFYNRIVRKRRQTFRARRATKIFNFNSWANRNRCVGNSTGSQRSRVIDGTIFSTRTFVRFLKISTRSSPSQSNDSDSERLHNSHSYLSYFF